VQGTLADLDDRQLLLLRDRTVVEIPLGAVTDAWVRGRSVIPGMIIGGLTGVAGGLVFGALLSGYLEGVGGNVPAATVGFGLLGGGLGALVGAAVGAAIPRWHRVFP
jgi:hypothetical protein